VVVDTGLTVALKNFFIKLLHLSNTSIFLLLSMKKPIKNQ